MTDYMIPRDAAHEEAFMDAVWAALKADATDLGKQRHILTALRAIPAIDPAAIREAALREAAALMFEDLWITADNDREEGYDEGLSAAHYAILALIGEKK